MRCDVRARVSAEIVMAGVFVALVLFFFVVMPYIRAARRPRHIDIKQMAQFHSMWAALELHEHEFDAYPPSDANDPMGVPYCGAMKLCEAVMGRDLLGMHVQSVFRADGLDAAGTLRLYLDDIKAREYAEREAHVEARRGPYLHAANANAYRLADIYGEGQTGPFDPNTFVMCDVYGRPTANGLKTGMPILYYRADPNGTTHDADNPDDPNNIYDYRDNQMLLTLGVPGEPNAVHPLSDPKRFYMNIQNTKIRGQSMPHNADTRILISAGYDGLYGTRDDICNFEWKYRK